MLSKAFSIILALGVLASVCGASWLAYKQFIVSEASNAAEGFSIVNHQTDRMGKTLDQTKTFISRDVSKITNLDILLEEWSPRYRTAQMAFRRFDYAIIGAEGRAGEYFEAQRLLTESYHSSEARSRAMSEDASELSQYEQWKRRAHDTRVEARKIMNRLDDMNVTLLKLELRSDFSFDVSSFGEIPTEILALEDDLAQFQDASDNIRELISAPFDGDL